MTIEAYQALGAGLLFGSMLGVLVGLVFGWIWCKLWGGEDRQ